jgi:hypothetical protein
MTKLNIETGAKVYFLEDGKKFIGTVTEVSDVNFKANFTNYDDENPSAELQFGFSLFGEPSNDEGGWDFA